jgi:glycine/D-amino acid oxidase-like deaminating enzyme
MMRAAEVHGAVVREAAIEHIDGGSVTADGATHAADFIIVALGPWSHLASAWLGLPAVYGLKGQSVVYKPSPITEPMNFFLEYAMENGERLSPEIVPRPDGTLYACGLSYEDPVPVDPGTIEPDDAIQAKLQHMVTNTIPALRGAKPVVTQACYRPVTIDGLPLVGPHPDHPEVIIATGHSVWGMLNGPATGEAVAELIMDGAASTISLDVFDPARLPFA